MKYFCLHQGAFVLHKLKRCLSLKMQTDPGPGRQCFSKGKCHTVTCQSWHRREADVQLYQISTSAPEGVGGQHHAPAALSHGNKPGTHRTGGWVGMENLATQGFETRIIQPVASCYIDYVIPASFSVLLALIVFKARQWKNSTGQIIPRRNTRLHKGLISSLHLRQTNYSRSSSNNFSVFCVKSHFYVITCSCTALHTTENVTQLFPRPYPP